MKKKDEYTVIIENVPVSKITGLHGGRPIKQHSYSCIVEVLKDNYVPEYMTLRSRIGSTMFTADVKLEFIKDIEKDPDIKSVAMNKRLHLLRPLKKKS